MGELYLASYCFAVLADIKPANLFRICGKEDLEVYALLKEWNRRFNKFDIYFRLVAKKNKGSLIFVYRSKALNKCLRQKKIKHYLDTLDYQTDSIDKCLRCVCQKLREDYFPHEIGCFLGYPFEDIEGFIKNNGYNYLCCGYWKVYHKKTEKEELFALYDRTKKLFIDAYQKGCDIDHLVI